MNIFSRVLVCACAGALIAGCSSAPYRSGKGSDHQVVYRPINTEQQRTEPRVVREVVYVDRDPYYYQSVPAYRVVTANPNYTVVTTRPAYQYVPVTRYYYVEPAD